MDAKEIKLLKEFMWNNKDLIKTKPSSQNTTVDYKKVDYSAQHPLYGTCHRVSAFYFWLKNGKNWKNPITMRSKYLPEQYNVPGMHTWAYNNVTKTVVDISEDQLPEDLNRDEFYSIGFKGASMLTSVRFDRFVKEQKKYPHQVPSKLSLELGRRWKKLTGSAEGLQYWITEYENRNARNLG